MNTMDRVIDWAEDHGYGVDADYRTGRIVLETPGWPTRRGEKKKFRSADDALDWARDFSSRWGFRAP